MKVYNENMKHRKQAEARQVFKHEKTRREDDMRKHIDTNFYNTREFKIKQAHCNNVVKLYSLFIINF